MAHTDYGTDTRIRKGVGSRGVNDSYAKQTAVRPLLSRKNKKEDIFGDRALEIFTPTDTSKMLILY
ncbi:MAG: hypothetical protein SWX82_04490 [Cyanobacteriota bacterium]|nr:hypothetical protein [Cyanobacteriota bacterium]